MKILFNGRCQNVNCTEVMYNAQGITGDGNYMDKTSESATNNIYGIYDMSGGYREHVMGVQYNSSTNTHLSITYSGFTQEELDRIEDKYIDKYPYGNNYNDMTRGKLGDATREVWGQWYQDLQYFVSDTNRSWYGCPWFDRGFSYSEANTAKYSGIFACAQIGGARGYTTTRFVVVNE